MDIAIKAVAGLREKIPELRLHIYGDGEARCGLSRLIEELDLHEHVHLRGWIVLDDVPKVISEADLGVVSYRQNAFTELLYPTKAFECIAVGVPVVMAGTRAVLELFGRVPDMFFTPEDVDALASLILALYRDPKRRQRLMDAAGEAYAPHAWEKMAERYVLQMRRLARGDSLGES